MRKNFGIALLSGMAKILIVVRHGWERMMSARKYAEENDTEIEKKG